MAKIHNLGFPRIGKDRELKKALEAYWKGEIDVASLQNVGAQIRQENLQHQKDLDWVPVNDFSFYDHVLDTSILVGNISQKYQRQTSQELDLYFRMARGRSAGDQGDGCCSAQEMTKWFDTNYHYLVPEFTKSTRFKVNTAKLCAEIQEAKALGLSVKPVLLGPVTYLKLGKAKDDSNPLDLLDDLIQAYVQILRELVQLGVEWVQMDEPILVTELDDIWRSALQQSYDSLSTQGLKILLSSYFGELRENQALALALPVAGLHLDAVRGRAEIGGIVKNLGSEQILSLGVIDGRNIWKSDLKQILDFLEPIHQSIGDRLWIAPSCSLLHVPVSLGREDQLEAELKNWLAFAQEKIVELKILAQALNAGRIAVVGLLAENAAAIKSRKSSAKVHNLSIKNELSLLRPEHECRQATYIERIKIQRQGLDLPLYPTTTIGSFPQTKEIRAVRALYKKGGVDIQSYESKMKQEIAEAVRIQEELGLDVLVHGEAERNDMVEYFGEQLEGFAFTRFGWVQSYGSRCVKPPIIYGDVVRSRSMTVDWTIYAQSLTEKPMKGMLTGPVTILNWSFVRDDQARALTCRQIALAIRAEVLELEKSGIRVIQIDEAALREGLPLRVSEWQEYLAWAVSAFRLTANGVKNETQIHTHMCYSEFNDIISAIAEMDADVITIETSRSQMELLDVFDEFKYPNEIGPGVYDIHTPNIPTVEAMVALMKLATQKIPAERLWVNPDCGLKTRNWDEVLPALTRMVEAAKILRS